MIHESIEMVKLPTYAFLLLQMRPLLWFLLFKAQGKSCDPGQVSGICWSCDRHGLTGTSTDLDPTLDFE